MHQALAALGRDVGAARNATRPFWLRRIRRQLALGMHPTTTILRSSGTSPPGSGRCARALELLQMGTPDHATDSLLCLIAERPFMR